MTLSDSSDFEMHVYAWEALTRVAMETADAPAEAVEVIKVHRQSPADPELLSAQIYVCKVKKAYDRGVAKLHLAGHANLGKVIDAVIAVLPRLEWLKNCSNLLNS